MLANAIQRGRPLRLPASNTSSDLKGLGQMLGLTNPGHLLSVPITSPERGPLGGILILSPYSNRQWSAEDQAYLSNVSPLFLPILERGQRVSLLETERDQAHQDAQSAQGQAVEAKEKYEEAAEELEKLHEKVSQSQLQAEEMAALLVMQEESQKTIESLKSQIEQMRQAGEVGGLPIDSTQLERELRQALEEIARMKNAQADSNVKILELEQRPTAPMDSEQMEVIASISQELRQPMSSIVGYTDLLMGESVGVLGALQRKFIERIKASTERFGGLVDDLIQITNLETGKMEFIAESIDLNIIIDNAMAYTSTQIREKNITLRLDIPEAALRIQTDRDALQQVFIHLLQNATAATQAEGIITLRVQIQSESNKHFISMQVTDTGGGIASEDIPRVFSRRFGAEQSLIKGLGDTGVGLSIAKSLVEAQGGRIWVETEAGSGSTFSILLPVLLEAEEEK
jgi:signal transduction histidine kinase